MCGRGADSWRLRGKQFKVQSAKKKEDGGIWTCNAVLIQRHTRLTYTRPLFELCTLNYLARRGALISTSSGSASPAYLAM